MQLSKKKLVHPLIVTLVILILFEIISSSVFPMLGVIKYRPAFSLILILYLGFKVESPFVALQILIIEYVHSFFTIDGWAMGTFAGIVICMIISYTKDLVHFSSFVITSVVVEIFQVVWFVIVSLLIYLKTSNFEIIIDKFWRFIPESLLIAILAPYFFILLDKIWKTYSGTSLGDEL